MTHDFFETDAGKFISRAKCFLEAAGVLDDKMADGRSGMLFTPTLHLVGHGIELLLKGCMLHNGISKVQVIGYGHRINDMWLRAEVETLRSMARHNAVISHEYALTSGRFPDAARITNPVATFEEYLGALGHLHAEPRQYPIRYPTDDERVAPRTPLLVAALWRTADDYVKRPNDFLIR
ncbi:MULTISPECIES: hypothetical protein [unclassified Rhizobium]|uniref:hypothetical protein n=1 Tax=unclassified Rhizobium TaxID=2613769 RepID=UPI001AD953E1|nr:MULTISPECIES: hypothetical protein [unclassified Rhizobium]MBO9124822.1 hypothetical protein [Rhizobium sp. 16-488-2b]MBO9175406.1 hypothetical protein [Rhizobium sp. 16-488-2a]